MKKELSILVVEDELIIAGDIVELLDELGISNTYIAQNYEQAVELLGNNHFDLILIDIILENSKSGISFANYVRSKSNTPFIYISCISNEHQIEHAIETFPWSYLNKPFSKEQLLTTIELCLHHYEKRELIDKNVSESVKKDFLVKKQSGKLVKIYFKDILYIQSLANYLQVKTKEKDFVFRCTLKQIWKELPSEMFLQCSKRIIINITQVNKMNLSAIEINQTEIPINKTAYKFLSEKLMQIENIHSL